MYLIKDEKLKKSLSERAKDENKTVAKSSLFELKLEKKKNIYDELEIVENVDLKNIINYDSCIFMFTRRDGINDLNNIFEEFIKMYKVVPSNIKATNHKISKFEFTVNNKVYYIVIDSNTNGNQVNYKVVRKLCKKNIIEFKINHLYHLLTN